MKNLSPRKKTAIIGLFFIFVVPWVGVFILDFFFIEHFPKQIYVHQEDFCFYLPENCQVVPKTSGDLDFYCKDGQSANLTFKENASEYLDKATIKNNQSDAEFNYFDISYKGKIYKLTSKVIKSKKTVYPIDCDTNIAAPKTPAESPKEF